MCSPMKTRLVSIFLIVSSLPLIHSSSLPFSIRDPSCVFDVQSVIHILTHVSKSDDNVDSYRNKVSYILHTFIQDFNLVYRVQSDQMTCDIKNPEDLKNKTTIYGSFYGNGTIINRPIFCNSDFPYYMDAIETFNPNMPSLNFEGVLKTIWKNYKDELNLKCRCVQNDVESTSKIAIWFPMRTESDDVDPTLLAMTQGFPSTFTHLIVPFGFEYADSKLWKSLIKEEDNVMPRGDKKSVEEVVQALWTRVCRLNGVIGKDTPASPPVVFN